MPQQKRPRDNESLMYFVDLVARLPTTDAALVRAHGWGEAMVRAELEALRNEGVSDIDRFNLLKAQSEAWYARGFRFFLLPCAHDAPAHLHAQRGEVQMSTQPEHKLRSLAVERAAKWYTGLANTEMFASAKCEPVPVVLKQRKVVAELALPVALTACLRGAAQANAPHPSMLAEVTALVHTQRILKSWQGTLEVLPLRSCALQMRLETHGLGAVFGNGNQDLTSVAGLQLLKRGGYNAIYVCGSNAHTFLRLLPPELSSPFSKGEVVLRAPLAESRWLTFDELVGELHDTLFTAYHGLGPRVAGLAYARKATCYKSRTNQGSMMVLYKVCAFLERGTMNAEERYTVAGMPATSALHRPYYFRALLVTIFKMSQEGYVHLDATLRNFVDFYPSGLHVAATHFKVKVIDVDAGCFRRLCPESGTDWQSLFLFNLLFVLVHLKICLGNRWDPKAFWEPVRECVEVLLSKTTGMASALRWSGTFALQEQFPDVLRGAMAGDSDDATTRAANAYLRFYLLQQPLKEVLVRYVNCAAATAEQLKCAKQWYDGTYRAQMLPPLRFFLAQLSASRQFVHVAREFLATPHAELQRRYLSGVPLAAFHSSTTPREVVLGLQ